MLKINTYPLGPIQTNCYIVQDEAGNCLMIDPGEEGERIISKIEKQRVDTGCDSVDTCAFRSYRCCRQCKGPF